MPQKSWRNISYHGELERTSALLTIANLSSNTNSPWMTFVQQSTPTRTISPSKRTLVSDAIVVGLGMAFSVMWSLSFFLCTWATPPSRHNDNQPMNTHTRDRPAVLHMNDFTFVTLFSPVLTRNLFLFWLIYFWLYIPVRVQDIYRILINILCWKMEKDTDHKSTYVQYVRTLCSLVLVLLQMLRYESISMYLRYHNTT